MSTRVTSPSTVRGTPDPVTQCLSEAECKDVMDRLRRFASGGGEIAAFIQSTAIGNVRWARNQINTSGDVLDACIRLEREIHGAWATVEINGTSDDELRRGMAQVERAVRRLSERPVVNLSHNIVPEPVSSPTLFSDVTATLDADHRAAAAQDLIKSAAAAGMLSAGYAEVSTRSQALMYSDGRSRYFRWTFAQYTTTVRAPDGSGSGWAGRDHYDWSKIDAEALSAKALEKCLASRNPVRVEPGRYTTILEPQALADLIAGLSFDDLVHMADESWSPWYQKLGERVMDDRITISSDPMDPDLGTVPWIPDGQFGLLGSGFVVPHATTWVERGVLKKLGYTRHLGADMLGTDKGLRDDIGSHRVSGGTTSIDEMIATTKRGLLVTRFDQVMNLDSHSQLCRGYTRDGMWLIEDGKISKPAKNLVFTDSPLFALNKLEQIGVPTRVWNVRTFLGEYFPLSKFPRGIIAPAVKVSDFTFTSLTDAV